MSLLYRSLLRLARLEANEVRPALIAFCAVFCIFTSYMMLRPVRETMGITAGVANLPALFWSIVAGMLLIQPIVGLLSARLPRTRFVACVYVFLALNLAAFYVWFQMSEDHSWIARSFFVWLSITNLTVVSLFWSVMADSFRPEQGKRLFGFISAGASMGGIAGPLITSELALRVGTVHLLPIAMCFLLLAPVLVGSLSRHQPTPRSPSTAGLGGSALAGFRLLATRRELIGIALFVVLIAWVATYLYMQQAQFVQAAFATTDERTRLFARVDLAVQILALLVQLFAFNHLVRWLGLSGVLAVIPAALALGCAAFAFYPTTALLIALMMTRRIGEYAVTRPAREVLFTRFDRETKYKAKNLIDTAVTRAPEAPAGSTFLPLLAATSHMAISWLEALLCAIAAVIGFALGRPLDRERVSAERSSDGDTRAV